MSVVKGCFWRDCLPDNDFMILKVLVGGGDKFLRVRHITHPHHPLPALCCYLVWNNP